MKSITKKLIRFLPVAIWCFSLPFASPAKADTFIVIQPTDITITFESIQNLDVRTYAQEYGIDSHLWLYDSNNNLIVANDDYYGLDSYININLQPGTYRLRAGVCCGNPEAWYGVSYRVETNVSAVISGATTTSTTTTSTSTTTTVPLILNPPRDLVVTSSNDSKVYLSWDAPEQSNVEVERYAIFWSEDNFASGWGISSNSTNAVVENLDSGREYQFKVRADNDTLGIYSEWSNVVSGETQPAPTTTTTSTTTTSTTTTSTTTTTTLPVIIVPETTTTWPATTTSTITTTTSTTTAPTTTAPVTTSTPITVVESTTLPAAVTIPTVPTTDPVETLPPSPEVAIVSSLSSDEIAEVLSPENLENLSSEEVSQLIENISESDLTDEQASAIAEALSDAPIEVKEEFEDQINIFGGQFDVYVPIGSNINVGQRRVLVAATAVAFTMPSGAAAQGSNSAKRRK